MSKQRKLIDLDTDTIRVLSIQAINKGYNSVKNYIEQILTELSKEGSEGLKKD